MKIEYMGLTEVNGPLIAVEGLRDASFDEMVEVRVNADERRIGRIAALDEDKGLIQVFQGGDGIALNNTKVTLTGKPMQFCLSRGILGRTFDGIGRPIDDLGPVDGIMRDVNGYSLNPINRLYPRNYINTGFSSIDGLTTLIRGQKLPIFSGNGLPHDQLAAQIVRQASPGNEEERERFAVVFAAMGIKYDVAEFFRNTFRESEVSDHVTMFVNLANDPVIERLITPKIALTAAEYLAFEQNMHVLVVLTDMTSFAEALREISSQKGEIPSRKGYPGYLYSELATIYERAGIVKNAQGSVTQIPILTMPNDDITHPIPDLTGYITEGQIVLDRTLHQKGIYPPINVLPSLSRLMKDGIGAEFTRADHQDVANQLFSCYARVQEARSLASVIGEDELSDTDKRYMKFGTAFEREFVNQHPSENRTIAETLDHGWSLLHILPREELDRIDTAILDQYYPEEE